MKWRSICIIYVAFLEKMMQIMENEENLKNRKFKNDNNQINRIFKNGLIWVRILFLMISSYVLGFF